jgi:HD-like signal output (HDOD) protein
MLLYKLFHPGHVRQVGSWGVEEALPAIRNAFPLPNPSARLDDLPASIALPLQENQSDSVNIYSGDYSQLPTYVDACYFNWVAGKVDGEKSEDSSFECKILEYLNALAETELAGSNLIPRVPSVMVQLLKRLHEDNVPSSELSRIISQDVVLVAGLLNEVNSSYYNLPDKITDISQAILVLGHTRLRMVLARISFTPIYNERLGANAKLIALKIWDESQKRALACYLLAKSQNVDPFMAFLMGLMQDVGLIVALRVFDRSENGQLPTSNNFRDAFQQCARVLSTRIGTIWSLPELVIKAIELQGSEKSTLAKSPLATVLWQGDFLSKTCTLIEAGQLNVDMESVKSILTEAEMDCLISLLTRCQKSGGDEQFLPD